MLEAKKDGLAEVRRLQEEHTILLRETARGYEEKLSRLELEHTDLVARMDRERTEAVERALAAYEETLMRGTRST